MKFQIEITPEENPNAVGEYLRDKFFAQNRKEPNITLGCYSTFDLRSEPLKLPDEYVPEWDWDNGEDDLSLPQIKRNETCEFKFTCATIDGIKMLYFWAGDGFLSFILPDGQYLINYDCKKTNNWELNRSFNFFWHTRA